MYAYTNIVNADNAETFFRHIINCPVGNNSGSIEDRVVKFCAMMDQMV